MTQRTNFAHTPLSRFWLRSMLVKSISCIGIFSLLGSNLALAQEAAVDNFIPTTSPAQPGATTATPSATPNISGARWQRLKKKLHSKPVNLAEVRPVVLRHNSNSPLKARTIRPVVARQINLNSPLKADNRRLVRTNPISVTDQSDAYIDRTEYKIGATTGYEAPKSVILSERLTGCKAVAQTGLSGSICRPAAIGRSLRVARLARSQSGSLLNRNRNKFIAKSGIKPIQVGPVSINSSGFRVATNSNQRSVVSYYPSFQPTGESGSAIKGLMFPLTIPAPITSLFGWRIHPITGNQRFHAGTDLGAPLGTPVLAAYPGSVEVADYMGGYGLTVVLNHNKSTQQTLYGHLSEIFVEPGESVGQGTVIGRVGSTGNSTGPHLHFETRQLTAQGWVAADPGVQLESAFAQLVKALQTAHAQAGKAQG